MIRLFVGPPGSCKTVHARYQIVQALQMSRSVYTNIEGLSWFGNGLFPKLHFLEPVQAQKFWRHVEPGSLIVIDEFGLEQMSGRHEFFECWFEEHYFGGTELILIGQAFDSLARFFHHQLDDCAVHKIVNPEHIYEFFCFDLFRQRFYGFRAGIVDNSYLFYVKSAMDVSWKCRRLFSLPRTLWRIESFLHHLQPGL